jgi:hypothetical protein
MATKSRDRGAVSTDIAFRLFLSSAGEDRGRRKGVIDRKKREGRYGKIESCASTSGGT